MFNQPLASRVENVNPFNMIEIEGIIRLNPDADAWTRTINVATSNTRVVVGRPIVLQHNTRIPRKNDVIRRRRRGGSVAYYLVVVVVELDHIQVLI